ncbi:MAG: amidohydrolase family protein [Deltaproteobacteria bacterium]|nr:amidohydrolase family protein [Deltaproteobacteria bacterium]
MTKLWIKNGMVFTGGDKPQVFEGGLLCEGDQIISLGPDSELEKTAAGAEVVDAGGRIVTPGFINTHMHLYSTLSRGMGLKDPPPRDFNQILERLWWRLDKVLTLEDLRPSAELPIIDALRAGVTTMIDHHASPGAVEGSLDVLAEAAGKAGLRLSTCYEVSDRDGPEIMNAGIAENIRFAKATAGNPMLRGMFGLHAQFTLSDASLDACAAAADELKLPFHVHVAEAKSDAEDARGRGTKGAVDRLHQRGCLTPGSLAVHCVHTGPDEWEILKEADVYAVHNPQSNMNNAVGAASIDTMMAAGVPVGIGTDGMQADVRQDMRVAFLLRTCGWPSSWATIEPPTRAPCGANWARPWKPINASLLASSART